MNYIRGKPARGRRKAVAPRYQIELWNVYDSVKNNVARTNNASEGWHNRFRVVTGKSHPSFYTFLKEIQKEQSDSETMLRQLSIGDSIRKPRSLDQKRMEKRITNIVNEYETYKEENNLLDYLKNVGYNIKL